MRPSALSALLVGGLLLAGCSSSHPSTPAAKPTPQPPPVVTLKQASHAAHVTARIPVADGWEGATWSGPKTATVRFWKYTGASRKWRVIGHSRYPVYPGFSCLPRMAGAVVNGAADPTYIVGGCFTGDGVLNTTAFANGPHGWGLVEQHGSGLAASGQAGDRKNGPASALFYNEKIDHGTLVTVLGNHFFDNADSWRYPLRAEWRWSGGSFEKIRDNGFTARRVSAPRATKGRLPAGRCPSSGSYDVAVGLGDSALHSRHSGEPIKVLLFPPADTYPRSHPKCVATLRPRTPIDVLAAHTSANALFLHRGHITHRQWISAPPWLLLDGSGIDPTPIRPTDVAAGRSPYVVPTSFRVNEILSWFHQPNRRHYHRVNGGIARPDHGIATFRDGKLVALAITPTRVLHPKAAAHAAQRLAHHDRRRHHHRRRH